MTTENVPTSATVDVVVSTAIRIAERTVRQWDEHDCHRMTDADRLLYEGEIEPSGVTMARGIIALADAERAIITNNLHLADGDDCTLRRLVRLLPEC